MDYGLIGLICVVHILMLIAFNAGKSSYHDSIVAQCEDSVYDKSLQSTLHCAEYVK